MMLSRDSIKVLKAIFHLAPYLGLFLLSACFTLLIFFLCAMQLGAISKWSHFPLLGKKCPKGLWEPRYGCRQRL